METRKKWKWCTASAHGQTDRPTTHKKNSFVWPKFDNYPHDNERKRAMNVHLRRESSVQRLKLIRNDAYGLTQKAPDSHSLECRI